MGKKSTYKELLTALMREEGATIVKQVRSIINRLEHHQDRIDTAINKVAAIHQALDTKPMADTSGHKPRLK